MTSCGDLAEKVALRLAGHAGGAPGEAEIAQLIRAEAGGVISDVEVLQVLRQLRNDTTGVGALEPVLAIPGVTDVVVNGPEEVWFDRGNGMERATARFESEQQVRKLATRLITSTGRRLDDAACFADARIARSDGSSIRVHAVLSPPAERGTKISLRVLRQARLSLEELQARGTISEEALGKLREIVEKRRSFLVIGGTGSGKTTLLSALLAHASEKERLLIIEDTAELNPVHPHVLTMVTRAKNTEGQGEVSMSELLKQALRMRPDRIILGEIRGAEVIDLLAALNTGHEGCAGTIHANSIEEVPARLEALAALGGMERGALHAQLAAARPMVLAMRRVGGVRSLHQIGELSGTPLQIRILWEEK